MNWARRCSIASGHASASRRRKSEKVKGPVGVAGIVVGAIGLIVGWRYYKADEEALIRRAPEAMSGEDTAR